EMPLPSIIKKNSEVLPMVREIISKLTNKHPYKRYQSANSLQHDIHRAINESSRYHEYEKNRQSGGHSGYIPHFGSDDNDIPPARSRQPNRGAKTPEDKRREKMIIGGGVLAMAVVIFLLVWGIVALVGFLNNDDDGYVFVPGLIGQNLDWAEIQLGTLGLDFDVDWEYSDDVPYRQIISSNVLGAGNLPADFEVRIMVSLGSQGAARVSVPDITGLHISQAGDIIMNLPGQPFTIFADDPVFSNTVPENHIIMQSPAPETNAPHGTVIHITYSLGPERQMSTMPNIIGLTEQAARAAISQAGLVVGEITVEESAAHARGTVIRQAIPPGQMRQPNTVVDFVLSDGILPETTESTTPETTTTAPAGGGEDENGDDENGYDENGYENGDEDAEPGEPTPTSNSLTLNPPIAAGETASLRLYRVEGGVRIFEQAREATALELPWLVTVTGIGTVEFVLMVDGVEFSQWVSFD
ncbi:MAG: PASTA domain-containing protein, partial [Defluviitaleaceae bacterium]|nr:PASTA domain-containing protein [Defluviitaleaceae bacterium]